MNTKYGAKNYTDKEIDFILKQAVTDKTWDEIATNFNKKFKKHATPCSVRKTYKRYENFESRELDVIDIQGPKILVLDIETKPIEAFVWGLWKNNVPLNMIKSDWCILSWAAKWLGEDEVFYMDQRDAEDIEDDSDILEEIWRLLDECDIVLHQNGRSFDIPKLNARFIAHGMQPPSSFRHIDTKILAKKHFKFTSNKLEYMTNLLTEKKKLKHAKFPGFSLWKECMKGNVEAWDEMRDYNEMDILSLEELYFKLAPWDSSLNFSVYNDGCESLCSCGNTKFKKAGFYYTNASKFQKFKCTKCGREVRDKVNLLDKDGRKKMKVGVVR